MQTKVHCQRSAILRTRSTLVGYQLLLKSHCTYEITTTV